ncbi:hypothetical protein [Actinoplanes sp. NPDC051851]|uniref:hypothetical protein n=1 Tax=Actinoplanes sp. NPDC051851 TaxID=3154753 RepID=UPI00343C8AF8
MRRRRRPEPEDGTGPIAYGPADRRADARHGRRDGRRRIPSLTTVADLAEAEARLSTPYQEELGHTGTYRLSELYQDFLLRTSDLRDQVARLRAALTTDLELIERGREALSEARAEVTESELLPRNPQELPLAGTPELAGRRESMRRQRIATAEEELTRRRSAADGRREAITAALARIDHEFALAQARARRLADYYVLRIASYWDAVVQTHPDGRNLSSALPPVSLTTPAWVDGTCRDGVVTLSSAEEVVP